MNRENTISNYNEIYGLIKIKKFQPKNLKKKIYFQRIKKNIFFQFEAANEENYIYKQIALLPEILVLEAREYFNKLLNPQLFNLQAYSIFYFPHFCCDYSHI